MKKQNILSLCILLSSSVLGPIAQAETQNNLNHPLYNSETIEKNTNLQEILNEKISGSDVTVYVNDTLPSGDMYQAKAVNEIGEPVKVTVDQSKVNMASAGDYDVLISTDSGQKKIVKTHVLEKKLPEQSGNDTDMNLQEPSSSEAPLVRKSSASIEIPETNINSVSDEANIAEGIFGTSNWYITTSGVLHIEEGTLANAGVGRLPWNDYSDNITKVVLDGEVKTSEDASYLFAGVKSIENLTYLDTSNATNMSGMFQNSRITSLDLSNFDTSNVTNMSNMFTSNHLLSLDLSHFNTANVTNMSQMFAVSWSLRDLNLSNFDTSNVTDMSKMFISEMKLNTLDLSSFTISNSTNISQMFSASARIMELKLGKNISSLAGSDLSSIPQSDTYTGKWQNVGEGTSDRPTGKNTYSSEELMDLYDGSKNSDTYVWQHLSIVTTHYQDVDGNKIADDEVEGGSFDEDYTTIQKDIDGYTFKEVKGNATGKFSEIPQEVTYIYTKDPVAGADVTAHYQD
ncbi:BspA family leucine-rich repeat surface protein, partial [Lactococcus garvieae]|uniref:BspA family leucine-rich repeat surface protein n=1 Tax=Lactococcus garvieae TaxID=1363 RepID=UPI00398F89CE